MSERNNNKIIFHIDVNSAFLSWTAIKMLKEGSRVDLREIPSIIGGDESKRHGIVLAKSIPAKQYHIHTAETIASAQAKCPNLEIVAPDYYYYGEQSEKLMELLLDFTPVIEQVSVDECYMDFSGIQNSFDSPEEAAYAIKDKVKNELGFTVNIGVSDVKVLAKMASDFQKPDRVHTLYRREIEQKMWPLPVGDLFFAGKSSVDTLNKLGIMTIGDLAKSPVEVLESHLKSHGRTLWEFANGIDDSEVDPEVEELKGVGNSVTLPYDYKDIREIEKVFLKLADKVSGRLRYSNQTAKTVGIEIKYNDFSRITRQMTVDRPTDSSREIYECSIKLFGDAWDKKSVRLLGIRTANLGEDGDPEQMSIMDIMSEGQENSLAKPSHDKLKKLDRALDEIKEKFGRDTITRASLLENDDDE